MGHPPRYGSRCPKCRSLERHRLLVLADQKEDFFTGREVLHFAPEAILSRFIVKRAKKYLTTDLNPDRADCFLNIERIDQPDESWDVVVCSHVLEHVNDQTALAELHRILRQDAVLVVMVPIIEGWETSYEDPAITSEKDRQRHFGQLDHVRYYGRDIRDRLKNAGFHIHEHTAYGSDVVKYGLLRGEKVFVCTKDA
jgi:SAM-dependent methyltransferase